MFATFLSRTVGDSNRLFWWLNASGWIGLSVVTYVSLTLPYNQLQFEYIAHNILQSALGFALSIPLRQAFRTSWGWSAGKRVVVAIVLILSVATIWAALRLQLLISLAGETGLWDEFGGFLFPSVFVFLAWVALYHLVKYAQLLQQERESLLVLESGRRQEAFKRLSAEASARDAQLRLLRYQLNPHFLFNTLNSVTSLISTERDSDAQKMITELSTFLRFSLESDRNITVPLRDEMEALDLYLNIEQVRFSDRLEVQRDIDPRALPLHVPSLVLQPLVENSIKHAIGRSEEGGIILVTAKLTETDLVLSVEDTGPSETEMASLELDQIFSAPGFGLRSTSERLENLFGDGFSFNASRSSLGGLRLTLYLSRTGPKL